jgi:hypothetical protein
MRWLPLLALAAAACTTPPDPKVMQPKLRNYLTEKMRVAHYQSIRTDQDSRARAPTKYVDAIQGLVFTIRHTALYEDEPITMGTWVYESQKARDAAKSGGFQQVLDDIKKEDRFARAYAIDGGGLHLLVYFESKGIGLANAMQSLQREIGLGLDEEMKQK